MPAGRGEMRPSFRPRSRRFSFAGRSSGHRATIWMASSQIAITQPRVNSPTMYDQEFLHATWGGGPFRRRGPTKARTGECAPRNPMKGGAALVDRSSESVDAKPALTGAGRADHFQRHRLAGLKQRSGDLDFQDAVAVFVVIFHHRVGHTHLAVPAAP